MTELRQGAFLVSFHEPGIANHISSEYDRESALEIAPEPTGHGLPLSKCEAYNRVYDQPYESN